MTVHDIRTTDEYREIIAKGKPVVVNFYTTSHGPCKATSAFIDELSNQADFDSIQFAKLDIDEFYEVSQELDIHLPSVVVFRDGQKVDAVVVVDPSPEIVLPIVQRGLSLA